MLTAQSMAENELLECLNIFFSFSTCFSNAAITLAAHDKNRIKELVAFVHNI